MLFLVKKKRKEESASRSAVVLQQPGPSVVKVRGEVFAHFHAVAVKCHSNMRN
jgi:hypothetical protein